MRLLSLLENVIGTDSPTVQVVFNIDKTEHAFQRGNERVISDDDIVKIVKKYTNNLAYMLIMDKLKFEQEFVLRHLQSALNIVCVMRPDKTKPNTIKVVIMTAIVKKDFVQKQGTRVFVVSETIQKVGDKYVLVSKSKDKHGHHKKLGTADTLGGIKKRERQVQYFKHL